MKARRNAAAIPGRRSGHGHGAEGLQGPCAEGLRGFLERRVDRLERAEQHEEGHRRERQHLRHENAGQAVDPAARAHVEEVGPELGQHARAPEEHDDRHARRRTAG